MKNHRNNVFAVERMASIRVRLRGLLILILRETRSHAKRGEADPAFSFDCANDGLSLLRAVGMIVQHVCDAKTTRMMPIQRVDSMLTAMEW